MALVPCLECGREVSTTAPTCPGCGAVLIATGRTLEPAPSQQAPSNTGPAIASLFLPGLGQLLQGRGGTGALFLLGSVVLWPFYLGWVLHLVATVNAAVFNPNATREPAQPSDGRVFGLPLAFWLVLIAVVAGLVVLAAVKR